MNHVLREPVCQCGSHSFLRHPQVEVYDPRDSTPGNNRTIRRWSTKAEREANPSLITCAEQKCLYIPDPSWNECNQCHKLLSAEATAAMLEKAHAGIQPHEYRNTETIGPAFANVEGIKSANFVP